MESKSDIFYIVSKDVVRAKYLAQAIRDVGAVSYYFDQWNDFWVTAKNEPSQFIIVDAHMWSKEGQLLAQHSSVSDGKSKVIFDCPKGDIELKNRPNLPKSIGRLFGDTALESQLSIALQNDRQTQKLLANDSQIKAQLASFQTKNRFLLTNRGDQEQFIHFHKELIKIARLTARELDTMGFLPALGKAFQEWPNLASFSGFQLGASGNKLIPIDLAEKMYVPLSSLWLGRACAQGIEKFAQDMAIQVAMDSMGKQVFIIRVCGAFNSPDILLFVTLKEQYSYFQWGLLEELLSSFYRQKILADQKEQHINPGKISDPWTLMESLEEGRELEAFAGIGAIDLNFTPLIRQIQANIANRFYWKSFKMDFEDKINQLMGPSDSYFHMGVHHAVLMISKENLEPVADRLKIFLDKFPYWKYFQDDSLVLNADIRPTFKLINPGAVSYLRFMERDFDGLESAISRASKRASTMFSKQSNLTN